MVGIDTNILVRLFLQDHPVQCAQADRVMATLSDENAGWVSIAVIMELIWVLTRIYRFPRSGIVTVLTMLLSRDGIVVEQEAVVRLALNTYRSANIGFADCLILASAQAAGCAQTLTFDQDAAKLIGMTLVS